jgi:alpha-methylacyl-CoA racemase
MNLPLHGLLILDCSTLLPGPRMGKLLALQGAHVIKIENPARPDRAKTMGAFYEDLNGCKEIIELDLAGSAEDRRKFTTLVAKADGLIEGFRPATKVKLGLDAPTLHAINAKLCIASLVGYPEDGPWADRAGHDMNFQAVTGCLSLFNEMPGLPLADLFGAYEGALSLTAAMSATQRGAPGVRLVISLSETLRSVQSSVVAEFRADGIVPKPEETLFSGKFPCYRVYTARCGRRVTVGAIEHKFWEKVCEILGTPELGPDAYATGEHGAKAIARLQAALGSQPWTFWGPHFDAADCCVEPVLNYREVYGEGSPRALISELKSLSGSIHPNIPKRRR